MPSPRLLVVLLLVALPACTGDKKDPVDPLAELRNARARLAVLAQATANGAYDAEYRFLQLPSKATGTIRIRQSPPQYRIDIVSKDAASFFSLTTGTVSCSAAKAKKTTCYLVAKRGEEVPALFDPGVQRLFRDAVEDLAAHPGDYLVTRVDTSPTTTPQTPAGSATAPATPSATATAASPPGVPAGECFVVARAAATPDPSDEGGFEDGTYCFAEQGVATSITVKSGSLTLVRVNAAPPAAAFKPPVKVLRLPDPTPTPKAKPSATPSR